MIAKQKQMYINKKYQQQEVENLKKNTYILHKQHNIPKT